MQVFDISLAPGGSRVVDIQASYIYFLEGGAGGADTTIAVSPTGGGETVYLKPGQAYKAAPGANTGSRWTVANLKGEGTIIGRVLMGEGEFSDNRVSGSVEVIDGGKNRVMAGSAFSWGQGPGPQNGLINHIQIFNPAGSGKNVIVTQFTVGTNVFDVVAWQVVAAPLVGDAGPVLNKKASGAVSAARGRVDANVASQLTAAMGYSCCNGSSSNTIKPSEPYVLLPGYGLTIKNGAAQVALYATIEFYEELQ